MYVTLHAAAALDGQYTVFGKVITGMDVVAKLQVDRSHHQSNRAGGKVVTRPSSIG